MRFVGQGALAEDCIQPERILERILLKSASQVEFTIAFRTTGAELKYVERNR